MSAPGRQPGGQPPARREHPLVMLAWRLMVAQTLAAALVGLPFSRRHLPSVLITLAVVAACGLLALLARTGTRTAWMAALGFESLFFLYGLSRFVFARYVGGTLFAIIIVVTMLHPAVARAFSVTPTRLTSRDGRKVGLQDAAGDTCEGRAAG